MATVNIPQQYQTLKTRLERVVKKIISPNTIGENENLNNYTEVGMYCCTSNAVAQTLTNCPTSDAFCLFVERTNVWDNGVKQTLTTYSNQPKTFIRTFYTNTDNDSFINSGWKLVHEDTGWKNVSFSSGYSNYGSDTPVRYRRIGKIVHIEGIFKNANAISSGASVTIGNISDTTCRPSNVQYQLQQGSSKNIFVLVVNPQGNIGLSRYGTTGNAQANSGAWLHCYITYFVD